MRHEDPWDAEIDSDETGAGVLWPVLRNAAALLAVSLALAWGVFGITDTTEPGTAAAPQAQSLAAASAPARQIVQGTRELAIPAGANGHFLVSALANGRQVQFLVDTGASGVMLTEADARKVGIYLASLDFAHRIQTANGEIPAARSMLRDIRIAGLAVRDVEVWVTRAPLPVSLLGMTFLNRLAAYEARGDHLILRW